MKCRFLVLVSILFSARLLADVPLPAENEKWLTVEEGTFRVYSNASPGQTQTIATELFRLREAMAADLGVEMRAPVLTTVFIFRNDAAFKPYRDALFLRRSGSISSAFFGSEKANFLLLQADAAASSNRQVYRELAHYLARNSLPGLPLWLYEGMADYYSTFRGRGAENIVGLPVPEYSERLRGQTLMSIADLQMVDANSPKTFGPSAWAVVHYLIRNGRKLTGPIEVDVARINGAPLPSAARAAGGGGAPPPTPAGRPEVILALQRLFAPPGDEAAVAPSIEELEESLSRQPYQPRAAVQLAQQHARAGNAAETRRVFDTYIANTNDPEILRLGRETLLVIELNRADDLIANGKDGEAKEIMRRVMTQTTNPRLRASLEEALRERKAIEKQLEVAEAAMARASAGKYSEAVKMLDELLPQIEDADFKRRVQSLRDDFARSRP